MSISEAEVEAMNRLAAKVGDGRRVPELLSSDNKVLLCAIYDSKSCEVLGGVFVARTQGEAIRMFSDGVNHQSEQKSVVQLHPEDFRLVQVGYLDRATCAVEGMYRVLIEGSEVRNA